MSDVDWYKKVLMYLANDLDYKRIVFELASKDPKMLLQLINPEDPDLPPEWEEVILKMLMKNSGNPVTTIKEYRALTGCSLKEAKDFVDAVRLKHNIIYQNNLSM